MHVFIYICISHLLDSTWEWRVRTGSFGATLWQQPETGACTLRNRKMEGMARDTNPPDSAFWKSQWKVGNALTKAHQWALSGHYISMESFFHSYTHIISVCMHNFGVCSISDSFNLPYRFQGSSILFLLD